MSGSLRALMFLLALLWAICLAVGAGWGALLVGVLLVVVLLAAWHEREADQ